MTTVEWITKIYNIEKTQTLVTTPEKLSKIMIGFAQHHVREALLKAGEKAKAEVITEDGHDGWGRDIKIRKPVVDKDSILNAYPLKNII